MLTDPFLLNAEYQNIQNLLRLEPLRFLAHFYTTAELPRPQGAEPYDTLHDEPTWERSMQHNFRGHMFGHYMSALSMAYGASDDSRLKTRLLERITVCVEELTKCQNAFAAKHPHRAGYIGPFGDGKLDELDNMSGGTGLPTSGLVWVPWYNLHKVLAGLLNISTRVTDHPVSEAALAVAVAFGEYFYNVRASQYSDENRQQLLRIEYGGMNDAFYELYRVTGDARFKTCAECFDEVSLFDALAEGRDVLPGKHANTQIPKFIGALKRYTTLQKPEFYELLTEKERDDLPKYLLAAKNFFDIVLAGHTYITGGNSAREHFHAPNTMAATINRDDTHETCNGHNMLKLARELFMVTNDKKYADYYENAFINVVLSSQNPETGAVTYFQPMGTGYNKLFGFNRFWCCVGTGVESFVKLYDSIYFTNNERVYVNMYFSSDFEYAARGLKLSQAANMPNSDTVTFTVGSNGTIMPGTELHFRIPNWCAGTPTVKINSEVIETPTVTGGYIVISDIEKGDKIELRFPMEVSLDALIDNPSIVAFRYGPVVLSAALGSWNMDATSPNGIMVLVAVRDPKAPSMIQITGDVSVEEWKKNIVKNLVRIEDSQDGLVQFKLDGTDMDDKLTFTPYYRQYKQRYGLYMTLTKPDSPELQAIIMAEKLELRNREGSTAYLTSFDNHAYEGEFNIKSMNSGTGMWNNKSYRHAHKGWFSYELPVTTGVANYLSLTLSKSDKGRAWDMFINDEFFATENVVDTGTDGPFYVSTHRIPDKYLAAKPPETPYITLAFRHREGSKDNFVGGIFGINVNTREPNSVDSFDSNPNLKSLEFNTGRLVPDFAPEVKNYTLLMPKDTGTFSMKATPWKNTGLVYVDDILIDDTVWRAVPSAKVETLTLNTKAEDHATVTQYKIRVERE